MNKLIGYLKIKKMIEMNIGRNMALMDTNHNANVMGFKNEVEKMTFFDSYEEFISLIKNMKDEDKKIFISMAPECSLENYFLFDHVKPNDVLMHFEKENGKTKCTFNNKSMKLKKEYYKRRMKEEREYK